MATSPTVVNDPMGRAYGSPGNPSHPEKGFSFVDGNVTLPGTTDRYAYGVRIPHVLRSNVANLVVGGFSGTTGAYEGFADALASQEGEIVITSEVPRSSTDRTDPQKPHVDMIAAIKEDLADNPGLSDAKNGELVDLDRINLILHSMAAISGTRHAANYPGEVGTVTYVNPVGLETPDTSFRFLKRIPSCFRREILPGLAGGGLGKFATPQAAIRMYRHWFSDLVQTAGEIHSCHTEDVRPGLVWLGGHGVRRIVLNGAKDTLVPAKHSDTSSSGLFDAAFTAPDLDHFGPQKKPRKTARYIIAMREGELVAA